MHKHLKYSSISEPCFTAQNLYKSVQSWLTLIHGTVRTLIIVYLQLSNLLHQRLISVLRRRHLYTVFIAEWWRRMQSSFLRRGYHLESGKTNELMERLSLLWCFCPSVSTLSQIWNCLIFHMTTLVPNRTIIYMCVCIYIYIYIYT